MVVDDPRHERSDDVPLPWLLVLVAWVWLLALVLFLTT
jgi:hypothetical protein